VGDATRELEAGRTELDEAVCATWALRLAAAGMHPLALGSDIAVSSTPRYREIEATMRAVAHREPTMALHVHVAVPDPQAAVAALDGLRDELPLLLALSANSPYWRGRLSGFAATRIPVLSMFPRMGLPRRFGSYERYVEIADRLLRSGAIPEPSFLWWNVRLQPHFGTIEVRIMDAQTRVADVGALAALVQCRVRQHAERRPHGGAEPEELEENRFLAARDGIGAELIDSARGRLRPAVAMLAEMLDDAERCADALGCRAELAQTLDLVARPGWQRQRDVAERDGVEALPRALAAAFASASPTALAG
jgi:carboxylate-amine ligase